jgi:hypothetical protein
VFLRVSGAEALLLCDSLVDRAFVDAAIVVALREHVAEALLPQLYRTIPVEMCKFFLCKCY